MPRDVEHLPELRRVDDLDLEEEDFGASRNRVETAGRSFLLQVLDRLARLGAVRDDVEPSVMSRDSAMNLRAVSSNSSRSARISVVRETRETSEIDDDAEDEQAEMASPSGFSMMFATSAYASTSVRTRSR